jgi:tRNA pseudouridine55 synthase
VSPEPVLDGLLVVTKSVGPTSHDVVARARGALGISKIGHTGTLDPAASGVLPLVVGRATRLARFLASDEKEYVATIRFGRTTDSYDAAGALTSETGAVPERAALQRALDSFVGTFQQTPPPYSAKKIDGVRAYALARKGVTVAPQAASVTAHSLELITLRGALAEVRITCSAGFYVRSLAHDLGQRVNTGASLDALVRVRSGTFTLAASVPFEALDAERRTELLARLLPLEALLTHLPLVTLTEAGVRRARHGRDVGPGDMMAPASRLPDTPPGFAASLSPAAYGYVRLLGPNGVLVGIGEAAESPGSLHPSVVVG